ncbi:hypothetical protein HDC30_002480 [Pseudomonas sp. JAI115]|uniref:hypothetical protein n=1 Tax=Pseudomonas sp. JAI115 TaxID=2723061 RepID=UPI001616ECA6|nr:hypothetical protein [Pseudomonas sp. JAI115]MBB6155257.1 hypothetical protein [Pseudomonas sp. JAI115]
MVLQLPIIVVAKLMLWNAVCDEGISRAELARRLHCTRVVATRLVDFTHPSKVGAVERALGLLDRRLLLGMERIGNREPETGFRSSATSSSAPQATVSS